MIAMGAALSIGSANAATTCTDAKLAVWTGCIDDTPVTNCDTWKAVEACALETGTGDGGYPECTYAADGHQDSDYIAIVAADLTGTLDCDGVSAVAPGLLTVAAAFIASKFL